MGFRSQLIIDLFSSFRPPSSRVFPRLKGLSGLHFEKKSIISFVLLQRKKFIIKEDLVMNKKVTDSIIYIGVDDKGIDLFESQYVVPNGISYNSYLIRDEKNVVMDTVDRRATDEWYENLR